MVTSGMEIAIPNFVLEDEYENSMQSFLSQTTESEEGMKWWREEMPEIVKQSARELSQEPFRVLAVGTGNGKPYDEELLDILSKLKMKVHYTVIEPRAPAVDAFKELAKSKYENVTFEWFTTTFENYQDKEWMKVGKKFDLIHFVHSLYYFTSSFETFSEILIPCYQNMLEEGGSMVTVLANGSGKKIFMRYLSTSFDMHDSPNMVGNVSRKENWNYTPYNINYKGDLTPCFDEDSETGNLMLDFLTRSTKFRQTSDKEQLQQVLKHLESQCELMKDGKNIAYPCNMDITVIRKKV